MDDVASSRCSLYGWEEEAAMCTRREREKKRFETEVIVVFFFVTGPMCCLHRLFFLSLFFCSLLACTCKLYRLIYRHPRVLAYTCAIIMSALCLTARLSLDFRFFFFCIGLLCIVWSSYCRIIYFELFRNINIGLNNFLT